MTLPLLHRAGWLRLYADPDFHQHGTIRDRLTGEYRVGLALAGVDEDGRRRRPWPGKVRPAPGVVQRLREAERQAAARQRRAVLGV